jgi:hypothetical protein
MSTNAYPSVAWPEDTKGHVPPTYKEGIDANSALKRDCLALFAAAGVCVSVCV